MSWRQRIAATVLSLALLLSIAALSRVPVSFSDPDQALVRLSWKVQGVTLEKCRERTPEELARLPVHMRNPKACIGHIAPYLLTVDMDGRRILSDTARAPGARGDRPIPVFAEIPVAPGTYRFDVRFDAIIPEGAEPPPGLPRVDWAGQVTVGSREVALLTLDEESGHLVLLTPEG
ncbi:MAG: hypothetical protein ACE5GJ_10895 [Gemmatimonadota bacterium]